MVESFRTKACLQEVRSATRSLCGTPPVGRVGDADVYVRLTCYRIWAGGFFPCVPTEPPRRPEPQSEFPQNAGLAGRRGRARWSDCPAPCVGGLLRRDSFPRGFPQLVQVRPTANTERR